MLSGLPAPGLATKWLCGLLVGCSVAAKLTERNFGIGPNELIFQVDAVLSGQLWRLLTFAFVEESVMGLLLSTLFLWIFGGMFEGNWGTRDYLKFFAASSLGGVLLAIPLTFITNRIMPFHDPGVAAGPDAAMNAMMVALAMSAPNSNVMFGFVLPMRAKTVIYIALGFQLITGLMNGAATLGVTLGGMAMGWLLVTGNWRPTRLMKFLKLRRPRKRRDGLYVVPPRDKHTLN